MLICITASAGLGQTKETHHKIDIRISDLRSKLEDRLLEAGEYPAPLPPICYSADLPANARFENDTIWIGRIQYDFKTTDDTLSILYHEYFHFLTEGKYTYTRDSIGQIVQWNTGETYTYYPDEKEIIRELQYFEHEVLPTYGEISDEQKEAHLQKLEADLSKPRALLFVYAPSNLAKEEIEAYEFQLSGVQKNIYRLSDSGRDSIERKLRQMRATLLRRIDYEEKAGLNSDGSEK